MGTGVKSGSAQDSGWKTARTHRFEVSLLAALLAFSPAGLWGESSEPPRPAGIIKVAMEGVSSESYKLGVESLIETYEASVQKELGPGDKGKVGLKVYTGSGPGLSTPVDLVRATLAALRERGFSRENLFLIDMSETRLRRAGFLPSLRDGGDTFEGHPVYILESGKHYHSDWYHENPMPPQREPLLPTFGGGETDAAEDRRSYLPKPLLTDVDFWINLPVYTEHPALGVQGALANATISNASNTLRFSQSEANGPAAVAEMAAIPELADSMEFTITSLERYQFAGGTRFHSLYTASEPTILLSSDPVLLDAYMVTRINEQRERRGFDPIDDYLPVLEFAAELGLGRSVFSEEWLTRVSPE